MALGPPPSPVPRRRGAGCAGCGCGLILILAVLLAAGAYGIYRASLQLTDPVPKPLPQVDGGVAVYQGTLHKIAAFQQAITRGRPTSLKLSGDEISTYIAHDPSMAAVRGRLSIRLEGDEAILQGSLPIGALENLVLADRYIDGVATLTPRFDTGDGSLSLDLLGLSLKSQPVPPGFLAPLDQSLNTLLARQIQANGPVRDFLSHTRKFAVEKGRLVIETR